MDAVQITTLLAVAVQLVLVVFHYGKQSEAAKTLKERVEKIEAKLDQLQASGCYWSRAERAMYGRRKDDIREGSGEFVRRQ